MTAAPVSALVERGREERERRRSENRRTDALQGAGCEKPRGRLGEPDRGSIVHDFNNLLVPMLGSASLALDQVGTEQHELRAQLEQIGSAGGKRGT